MVCIVITLDIAKLAAKEKWPAYTVHVLSTGKSPLIKMYIYYIMCVYKDLAVLQ